MVHRRGRRDGPAGVLPVPPVNVQATPEPEPIRACAPEPTPIQPLVQSRPPVNPTELPIPTWVTVTEAAFLSRLPVEQVLEWIERDIVGHHALVGGATEPSAILVRTSDLEAALIGDGRSLDAV